MRGHMRACRAERGWTAKDVAERLNVSTASVYRWESGESDPTSRNLLDLGELYGRDMGWLMEETA